METPLAFLVSGLSSIVVMLFSAQICCAGSGIQVVRYRRFLPIAHVVLTISTMLVVSVVVRCSGDELYGDVFAPFIVYPGFHLYYPAQLLANQSMSYLSFIEFDSVTQGTTQFVLIPGVIMLFIGAIQWCLLGVAVDWVLRVIWRRNNNEISS